MPGHHTQTTSRVTALVLCRFKVITARPWTPCAELSHPAGHARVMVLTPGGPQFGQGPVAGLSADPVAGSFISAAFSLMQLLISRAMA